MPKWAYLPEGWDDQWRAAKFGCRSAPAWVTVLGESCTQGNNAGASGALSTTWFARVRAGLLEEFPLYGDCWPAVYSQSFGSPLGGFVPWANNGAAPSWGSGAFVSVPRWTGAGVGDMTFASPEECEGLDLLYLD